MISDDEASLTTSKMTDQACQEGCCSSSQAVYGSHSSGLQTKHVIITKNEGPYQEVWISAAWTRNHTKKPEDFHFRSNPCLYH